MSNYAKSAAVAILGGIAMYFSVNSPNKIGKGKKSVDDVDVDDPPVGPTLVKVAFVFRHGDRAPLSELPDNSISASEVWPDGRGELTKIGKRNSYLLGRRLRKRYDAILTPYYSKNNLVMVSTKVERTMMSALLVLAGLYPPKDHQEWSDTIPWTPIPVYHNSVFNASNCFSCPRFKYEAQKQMAGAHQSGNKFEPLYNFAEAKAGYTFKDRVKPWKELLGLFEALSLKKRMGLARPEWTDEFLQLGADASNDVYYTISAKTEVQKQLSSSLMSDYLLGFLEDQRRVSLFSAHDLTLYMLSGSLGFGMMRQPLPTSCIAVEVHEKNTRQYVKAFYITEATGPMVPIEMGCGVECEMSEFVEMLKKVKPDDYNALCHEVPDDVELTVDKDLDRFLRSVAIAM